MLTPAPVSPLAPAALVTGAGRRIGRAIALELASMGYAVAAHYQQSAGDATDLVEKIRAAGGRAEAIKADLVDEAQVVTLLPRATAAIGPVTCLVNNASIFERDEIADATRESWDRHMEINLRAPFVLTQAFAAALPAGARGDVVNLLDQRIWAPTPHFVSYTVSKLGLWCLTQTLALALAPRIRVNGIGPGPTLPSPHQSQAQFDAQCAAMPLGHGATPDDVCRALHFILTTPSVTGQMIALDGGQHLGWSFPSHAGRPED